MAYATVAELAEYLGIDGANDDDALLNRLMSAAQRAVDNYTGRTFEAGANSTRYFHAIGPHIEGRRLYFDKDCASINSITNGDGSTVSVGQYVTLPANDTPYYGVQLKLAAGVLWTYSTDYENAISVSAKWAYSVTPPADVKEATVQLAAYMYRQKDAQVFDVTAMPDAGIITIPKGIPTTVKNLLAPYRRLP